MSQLAQRRASKAISRAKQSTKKRRKSHLVIKVGDNFRTLPADATPHEIVATCGADLIFVTDP